MNIIVIDKQEAFLDSIFKLLKDIKSDFNVTCYKDTSSIEADFSKVDLIIFNTSSYPIEKAIEIRNRYHNIHLLAILEECNSSLASELKDKEVEDFLLKPVLPNIFEATIEKIKKDINGDAKNKTIAIFSNKGGVGKTSLAINLAYNISQISNEKVCLLDLNFFSDDIHTFLDLDIESTSKDILSELITGSEKSILSLIQKYKNTNMYILSLQENFSPNLKFSSQTVCQIISFLKNIFEYIIIDMSSAIDEINISILNSVNLIMLVGLLNLSSIRNCQKCYELFSNLEYKEEKIKLILNRYIENSEITLEDLKDTIGHNVFYKIPNNYLTLIDAINLGLVVEETNPNSNIAKAYKNLASKINGINFSDSTVMPNCDSIFNLAKKREG